VASFPEIMASQPSAFQSSTLATLMSGAQALGAAWSLYQSISNLGGNGSWGGSTQLTQAGQATSLMGSGQQVLGTLGQTQMTITMGAQQMQAAKAQLTSIVATAKTEGFVVLPTGQVILGPTQLARIAKHPGAAAYYAQRMATLNSQIQAVVLRTTLTDVTTGLMMAKTGVDIISAFMKKDSGTPAPAAAPGTVAPAAPIVSAPTTPGQFGTGSGQLGPATGLAGAGVGPLGGAFADGGAGGLRGAGMLSGAGGGGGVGGAAGLGPGGVAGVAGGMASGGRGGAGAAGVVGARAGAGGTALGVGGAPVGAGRGTDEDRESTSWLLTEDDEMWKADNVPDTDEGVLS